MRIVGGKHRGRPIVAPDGRNVRPTADRVREAVFNILAHGLGGEAPEIQGAHILDAFAGTGAMGLEALSRGAAHATFMDVAPGPCRANVTALGEEDRCEIIRGNCLRPPSARDPSDFVFVDPPYGENCCTAALTALDEAGWITAGTICVVESDTREDNASAPGFTLLDDRQYGIARVQIFRRSR